MEDPIKAKLKEDKMSESIREGIRARLNSGNGNLPVKSKSGGGIIRRMYDVGNPVQTYGEDPGLAQLEVIVIEVNEGQRQLEKIRRMNESALYRGYVHVSDAVLGLVRRKPTKTDVHELFLHRQQNVRGLNYILASMVGSYSDDVQVTRGKVDSLITTVTDETLKRRDLKEEIPPEIQRYDDALAKLQELDKDKEPKQYYLALQEVIDAKRVSRKKRFEYVVTAMGQEHHREQIDNLMMQEELFETMLYRVMEMAFKTELYQQTLDNNERIWRNIVNLSKAVNRVSGGIGVLSDFNRELLDSYVRAVREIVQLVEGHPGRGLLLSTNRDVRQLVADVNASAYRDAAQYENE